MTEKQDVNIDSESLRVSPQIKFVKLRNLLVYIGEQLSSLLKSKRIGIYLRGRESGNWALAISRDITETIESCARVISQDKADELNKSIENRQVCLLEEILEPDPARQVQGSNLVVTPMVSDDDVVALLLSDFDAFASLSDRHLIQLTLAAKLIKTAVEREFLALQVSRLEKNASEKTIPGEDQMFHSKKLIDWVINREMERADRHGSSFAILVITFDNLAHILSEHGEKATEKVLMEQFEVIRHIVRKCDLLTRRGGHQFLCVTMEQDAGGVMVLAAKIRHRVKEIVVPMKNSEIKMTVSVGIALYPDGPKTGVSDLLSRAESELTEAQKRGNRVLLWRPDDSGMERTTEIPDLKRKVKPRKPPAKPGKQS